MTVNSADRKTTTEFHGSPRQKVMVFDVNQTLSDMSPMASRFVEVGVPPHLAATWFAALLRDGFALTAAGSAAPFAQIGASVLRSTLAGQDLNQPIDDAVKYILAGFDELTVHRDVLDGLPSLKALGYRLITLSNGAAGVAEDLLDRAGLVGLFEALLSVEDAGAWKPAESAYLYATARCRVELDEMMLVAVHPWDIDGATRAGMRTAWINRTGAAYPDYFLPPTVEAVSLLHLAHMIAPAASGTRG